jgi:uncharacterized protein
VALTLYVLEQHFSICQLAANAEIPPWATGTFCSVTRTSHELSIVCESALIPADIYHEAGWRALMVKGPLAFSEVGILAGLAEPLANAGIAIFVLSTFATDYLLLKDSSLQAGVSCLKSKGYEVHL